MQLRQMHAISEGTKTEVAKAILDVLGFIPGAGEFADLTNVGLHLRDKEYLEAAMSLISIIPEAGDVAGKGTKYLYKVLRSGKNFKPTAKMAKALTKYALKILPKIRKYWKSAIVIAKRIKNFRPYIEKMTVALKEFISEIEGLVSNANQQEKRIALAQ